MVPVGMDRGVIGVVLQGRPSHAVEGSVILPASVGLSVSTFVCLLVCCLLVWFGLVWFGLFGLFVCLSVCLSACRPACLSVSVCRPAFLSACLPVCLFACC